MTPEKMATVNEDNVLHVMSYNVLANRLATLDKFSHTTRDVLHFDFRGPRIMQEMAQTQANIICMQEVDQL